MKNVLSLAMALRKIPFKYLCDSKGGKVFNFSILFNENRFKKGIMMRKTEKEYELFPKCSSALEIRTV